MAVEFCPNCSHTIGPPLQSGRQVCMKCGWSNRPKASSPTPQTAQWQGIHEDAGSRRLLSIVCHASLFLSSTGISILVPILCWVFSRDSVVRSNAKEVLSFQINVIVYGIVCWVIMLMFTWVGLFLLGLLVLGTLILPIFAIVHCVNDSDRPYIYPYISHLF